jgi:serine/threonine-protein kinase
VDTRADTRLGRYRLITELGRGGMGVVWLARDQQLQRTVAVKLLDQHVAANDEFRARFAREMRIAVKLEHPSVVPVYDAGEVDGRMFIAMRYVKGCDLGVILRDGRVEPERVVRIGTMLGSALDAAHALGLVHRDVKPANILIADPGPDEHAYLTDFGISRDRVSDSTLTRTGEWMGTADYVSPEQLDGRPATAQSDVYSLTCLLFHALTGAPPYPGPTITKLKGHVFDPLPSVGAIHPRFEQIDRVLDRGARKQPEERYASAGELTAALNQAVGAASAQPGVQPTAVAPTRRTPDLQPTTRMPTDPPVPPPPTAPARRGRRGAWVAAGVVLVAVAAAVVLLATNGSQPQNSTHAGTTPRTGGTGGTGAGAARKFTIAVVGAHTGSVWFVHQGDSKWSSTGVFDATGNPSLGSGGTSTVVAARGSRDGTIWYATVGTPGWSKTGPLTGAGDPAVAVSSNGKITIAERGTDNIISYVQPGLRAWTPIGSFTAAGNPAIAEYDGRTVIAARSLQDGTVWYTTTGASGWTQTGPASEFRGASDPAVAVGPTGQITIAERGTDDTIWYVQPGLHVWTSTGHLTATGNPAIAENDGRTVIAARSLQDGTIWYTTTRAAGGGWTQTGPASKFTGASDPAVAVGSSGQVTIADRRADGTFWYVQPGLGAWTALGSFYGTGRPALIAGGSGA